MPGLKTPAFPAGTPASHPEPDARPCRSGNLASGRPDADLHGMLDWLALRMHVSTTVAALVVALVAVQLTMQVYALVDLSRRDTVRGGPKWLWVMIIAFGNLVGAIAYLAVGRTGQAAPPSDGGAAAAGSDAARRAVDALYGPRDRT